MSLVFILPLIVLYQIGIVQSGSNIRNLAEVWVTGPLAVLGLPATTVINLLVICGVVLALWHIQHTGTMSVLYGFFMVLESLLYALLLFSTIGFFANKLDQAILNLLIIRPIYPSLTALPLNRLLLGIGAGVYEELLFRVLLLGGSLHVLRQFLGLKKFWALLFILPASSLLFSAAHHIGNAGEAFNSYVFIFRTMCGLVLSVIYIFRGPGIPVMTHSLYNLIVIITMTFTAI